MEFKGFFLIIELVTEIYFGVKCNFNGPVHASGSWWRFCLCGIG